MSNPWAAEGDSPMTSGGKAKKKRSKKSVSFSGANPAAEGEDDVEAQQSSDTEPMRKKSEVRTFRTMKGYEAISCGTANYLIRTLGFIAGLSMIALSGYTYILVEDLWEFEPKDDQSNRVEVVEMKYSEFALYTGVITTYYLVFGILMVFAEIRTKFLKKTILKPFGFLKSGFGRGMFYVLIGFALVVIQQLAPILVGALTCGVGIAEIVLALLVKKKRVVINVENPAAGQLDDEDEDEEDDKVPEQQRRKSSGKPMITDSPLKSG